jgi:hypothetical protein
MWRARPSLQEANEGPPVPEEQYQERFWRRRPDGIGLDTATKQFLVIEFKRTQDARGNYVERATAGAQEQYKSLLTGLQAVGQVKGWKVQQSSPPTTTPLLFLAAMAARHSQHLAHVFDCR